MRTVTVTINFTKQSFPQGTVSKGTQVMLTPDQGFSKIKVLTADENVATFNMVDTGHYFVNAITLGGNGSLGSAITGEVNVDVVPEVSGAILISVPSSMSIQVS